MKVFSLSALTLLGNKLSAFDFNNPNLVHFLDTLGQYTKHSLDYDQNNNWDSESTAELARLAGIDDRSLDDERDIPLSANFKTITTYGCYCYFEENFSNGKGMVQDEIDGFCKKVQDGYFCASFDDPMCDPSSVEYNYPIEGNVLSYVLNPTQANMDLIMSNCRTENPNDTCAQRACMIEMYFIASVTRDITLGNITQNLRKKKGFKRDEVCVVVTDGKRSAGGDGREFPQRKECCGMYPHRFCYKHVDGKRECCGDHTYDAMLMQCCSDGTVSAQCT